jgi:hypothetical protein
MISIILNLVIVIWKQKIPWRKRLTVSIDNINTNNVLKYCPNSQRLSITICNKANCNAQSVLKEIFYFGRITGGFLNINRVKKLRYFQLLTSCYNSGTSYHIHKIDQGVLELCRGNSFILIRRREYDTFYLTGHHYLEPSPVTHSA